MYLKSVDDALKETGSGKEGLTTIEAARRLEKNGANKLNETKKKSGLLKFFGQFKETMILVLIAAAALSAVISYIEKDLSGLADTVIILVIVFVNALIGFVQEYKAEKELEALRDLSKPFSKVLRNGQTDKVRSEELVEGDIVLLEAGDIVPADLRLIESASLKIQEAALTGESVPSEKNCAVITKAVSIGDRKNTAFSSGVVSYGRGKGVVYATGMNTEIGKIAGMLSDSEAPETPLQKKLNVTGKVISISVILIAAVIFAAGLFSTAYTGGNIYVESLMRAIAIAVAAIPEGLPAVVTIVMAFGMRKLSAKKAIMKKLPAVETLGCTEVICSDKTGTLTLNRMTVKEKFTFGAGAEKELYSCMVLCSDAELKTGNGEVYAVGDPTETALVEYACKAGVNKNEYLKKYPRIDEKPFDSVRKLMSVAVKTDGVKKIYTKGAPDEIIKVCSFILDNGGVRAVTEADRLAVAAKNRSMAVKTLRVLGFAMKADDGVDMEKNLVFIGLAGMIDPPRPEVREAVSTCARAGMLPVMITGDHKETAAAIAKELGMITSDSEVITGKELDGFTEEEFLKRIAGIKVYARVSPENKVRIVKAWKKLGKVVAMTGDGVNDAPSIKAADIGIGMGITGTDVTKSVADMVLSDDNFATIILAVEEGRKIFANIQKAIQFLLSANIAEVLSLFIMTIFFRHLFFLVPIHLLWVNLVTDSLPALALGTERAEKDIMDKPPRKSESNMFKGRLGIDIIYQGIAQTAIILFIFFWGNHLYGNMPAVTMSMAALCFIQLFHAYNVRSREHSIFTVGVFSNGLMNLSFLVGAALTVSIVAIPALNGFFNTTLLTLEQWAMTVASSFAIIPIVEIVKIIFPFKEKGSSVSGIKTKPQPKKEVKAGGIKL